MTCNLSAIDLESGEIVLVNASHPAPFVIKSDGKRVRSLRAPACGALGQKPALEPGFCRYRLKPGDVVVWHTDGLTECENAAKQRYRRLSLVETIRGSRARLLDRPEPICDLVLGEVAAFLGSGEPPVDDITLVIAVIPALNDGGSGSRSNPPESRRS